MAKQLQQIYGEDKIVHIILYTSATSIYLSLHSSDAVATESKTWPRYIYTQFIPWPVTESLSNTPLSLRDSLHPRLETRDRRLHHSHGRRPFSPRKLSHTYTFTDILFPIHTHTAKVHSRVHQVSSSIGCILAETASAAAESRASVTMTSYPGHGTLWGAGFMGGTS